MRIKVIVYVLLLGAGLQAQTVQVSPYAKNYPHLLYLEKAKIHFGFFIGANISHYRFERSTVDAYAGTDITGVSQKAGVGLTVGLLGEWHILPLLSLRLVPDFSLESRSLVFDTQTYGGYVAEKQTLDYASFNVPLMLKFRSVRLNDFALSFLVGAGWGVDISSRKEDPTQINWVFPNRHYGFISLGTAFDFHLQFFKLGVEFRYDIGLNNLLPNSPSEYGQGLKSLNNHALRILLSFEG
jgi:hypothetical protein